MSKEQCIELLKKVRTQDVMLRPRRGGVVTHDHSDSVGEALNTLARENILSAPVLLAPSVEDQDGGTYMGMVDVTCLLKSILRELERRGGLPAAGQKDFLEKLGKDLFDMKLVTIMGHDSSVMFRSTMEDSLYDIIHNILFNEGQLAVHRITLLNSRGDVSGIISQFDVARYLHRHRQQLGDFLNSPIAELGLVTGAASMVKVGSASTALEAFVLMNTSGVSAVPVVEAAPGPTEGSLLANLSASDLRGLRPDLLPTLLLPVLDYLKLQISREQKEGGGASRRAGGEDNSMEMEAPDLLYGLERVTLPPPVACFSHASLGEVLGLMVEHHVHRVYVVAHQRGNPAAGGAPVGVVTLTDILMCLGGEKE